MERKMLPIFVPIFWLLVLFANGLSVEKPPSEATFRGSEFISYKSLPGEPIESPSDEISLYFKTRQPSGLLFYTGDGQRDYLNLGLKEGGVALVVKLGSSLLERTVKPSRVRFDDNQWHKVVVYRKVREFSITVDGVYTERGSTTGTFTVLSSSILFVGGSNHSERLPGSRVQSNFIGCLRKVEFSADSLLLDILHLARSGNALTKHHGNLPNMCQEVEAADPVTFTTGDSFLALPKWEATRAGSLSLKIRTNEPNGVLLYNRGAQNGSELSSDFFAFELLDGHIYLLLNFGSGAVKVKATTKRVDEGHWHVISLRRTGKSGRVTVDESAVDFIAPGSSNQLDLEGRLYLGGVGISSAQAQNNVPSELWAGTLRYGFIGCVRDLVMNGNAIDIASFARRQDSGSVRPACHTSPPQCESQPCMNGGQCSEGWNRFICQCSVTSFTGPACAKEATTLSFNGEQFMKINLPEEMHTQAEDLHLRFRTTRPNGLLLATTANDKSMSHLILSLESSRAKVSINLGEGSKVVYMGHSLNDDQWHSLKVERRGPSIEIKLDAETQMAEITGQSISLHVNTIRVGALAKEGEGKGVAATSSLHQATREVPNFVGLIQQLIINGNNYLEMARHGQMSYFNVTAKFGERDRVIHHPVTFKSKNTFIGLPQLKAYSTMNLYFQFKTLEPHGLILFNGGKGQDFLGVELVNGHIHYVFNLGDGPRRVRSNTRTTLNDNRWHTVTISRPSVLQHTLMVDDLLASVTSTGSNIHMDLDGLLYLGGVRKNMYETLPKLILSKHGFEGCVASLDLNGETLDPSGSDALIPSTLVEKGCSGPVTKCSNSACSNRGICVQMWNSYACDCDMTSYAGPTCAEGNESTAYKFGTRGGLITFTFPPDKKPDTKNDLLAVGFMTSIPNAVLVRIDSGSSNDYMELQIVDGSVLMVYNLGYEDHDLGELSVKVNDNQYHIVRFTRSGPNSTIQVDNHNVMTKHPAGKQLTIFNSHSKVQIGGKKNSVRDSIEKPYQGILAGLVFNGHRLLDMAAEDDPRIAVEGDVELLISLPHITQKKAHSNATGSTANLGVNLSPPQMQQPKSAIGYEGDELILSGDGSGCWDDEDCSAFTEAGSGDDLITPTIISLKPTIAPNRVRTSTVRGAEVAGKVCDDEEDDCFDGSGSGEPIPTKPSNKIHVFIPSTPSPSSGWGPTAQLPTYARPIPQPQPQPEPTTDYEDKSILYTSRPIPPAPPPSYPGRSYPTPRPSPPPRPTGRPVIVDVPKPVIPQVNKEKQKPTTTYSKSSADRTAMVIGLIAVILVVIVIIAPIVVFIKVKYRTGGPYKVDETKNFQFAPVSGTPPLLAPGAGSHQQTHLNGTASRTPLGDQNKGTKLPKKKDLKEWYV